MACQGGGGFFVHSDGVGVCFIFHFYVESNTVKYFPEHFSKCKQTPEKQTFFWEIICI